MTTDEKFGKDHAPSGWESLKKKPEDKQIRWNAPSEDRDAVIRGVYLTEYSQEGIPGGKAGGISVLFKSEEDAKQLYKLIRKNSKNPYYIDTQNFSCVYSTKKITGKEAVCLAEDNPRMLHMESIAENNIRKLNGAIESLFKESLPKAVLEEYMKKGNRTSGWSK